MLGKKTTKKRLIILDFDGTIFFNPSQNYSVDVPLSNLLQAHHFFSEFTYQSGVLVPKNTEFVLITGRHKNQEEFILYLLRAFGYKIDRAYFNQMERNTRISENDFLIRYWTEKVKLINCIREGNDYSSIIVIEDDNIVCSMLRKLNFEVYQAKIAKQSFSQPLSISFNRLDSLLATKLQNTIEQRQEGEVILS
jgi:hypothetical protein